MTDAQNESRSSRGSQRFKKPCRRFYFRLMKSLVKPVSLAATADLIKLSRPSSRMARHKETVASIKTLDFSTVLLDVMVIADEVDSQLKQTVLGFTDPAIKKSASLPA